MRERLGDILKALGLVDDEGLEAALRRKAQLGGRIGEHLVAVGAVDEDSLLRALARQHHVPFADASMFDKADPRLRRLVPRSKAFHYRIVPVRYLDGQLILATCESSNLERSRELIDALGHRVRLVLASRQLLEQAISRLYSVEAGTFVEKADPPRPARLRSRKRRGALPVEEVRARRDQEERQAIEVTQRDSAPPAQVDDHTVVEMSDEERIARELERELPPDSGVFLLTREALSRYQTPPPVAAGDRDLDGDTVVSEPERSPPGLADEVTDKTVFDPSMAQRVRERLADAAGQHAAAERGASPALQMRERAAERRLTRNPAVEPLPSRSDTTVDAPRDAIRPALPVAALAPLRAAELRTSDSVPPIDVERVAVSEARSLFDAKTEPPGAVAQLVQRGEPFGNYLLLRRIKTGGMAEVFEATTRGVDGIGRTVAIKRILPNLTDNREFVDMFIDEAKITVQLNHSAIGQVFELGKVEDNYFIAMEFINGRDLNAIFNEATRRNEAIPLPIACFITQQLAEGLDYAHRKTDLNGKCLEIVHRDVSPANVLCSFEGAVKIIDFGIAKAVSKVSLTRPGLIKGKISYMSPEQMRGKPIDRRSDVFAAGIIFYEMLTGRRLFVGNSDVETIRNVLRGEVPPVRSLRPEVSEELAAAVHRALEREPQARFAWASELSTELQRALIKLGIGNPRGLLAAYMAERFMGLPVGEEEA
ncbi:MAG: protein kinase [Deltaproteobacteria bacterium]|nr:protein kinase [Deltaproteobacteria bacterium]